MHTLLRWSALLLCLGWTAGAGAAPAPVFGSPERRLGPEIALPQWQAALARLAAEAASLDACARGIACPSHAVGAWLDLLGSLRAASPLAQAREVNRFVNAWPYRPDLEAYGARDHWATPTEFLARSGDCEDFALVKYVSLRRLGFAPDRLRLVVVHDTERAIAHAVLLVRLEQGWRVLDNLTDRLLPPERIRHYRPYYSVNEETRWSHLEPAPQAAGTTSPAAQNGAE